MTNCNSNIVSILHQRAIEHGDRLAYIFLKDGTTIGSSFTYKELDRKARAIATALQSQADRGERALLLYSSSEEFLPAFFGCLYANIIAVPTPAIDAVRLKRSLPRLKAIATDSQATIILTTSRLAEGIEEVYTQIPQLRSAQLLVSDAIDTKDFLEEFDLTTSSKDLAYLQYTSGSTSSPKGVMISHENAIDNLAYITEAHGYDETSISATWTPFFHDYGLVNGLLLPIYAAIPCYVLSPISFIKKPLNWLKAISRYRVTHSGAPNFAYDYCVDRIKKQLADLDLSSWRVAHTGAETIRRQTLEEFAQTFESYGFDRNAFYPSYGLAEATLMATTRSRSDSPVFLTVAADKLAQNKVEISPGHEKTQVLTGCGYPTGNTQIVIVDPQTLTPRAANEVGEIWVTSKSVAQGYWNRPEETKQIFQANLSNLDASFLRTGDLGFFKYGQLFVAGRLKDLIVIRGKNYYPQDIEFAVEKSHPQLRANSSAVFSIDVDGVERLVVAAEVNSRSDKNLHLDEIIAAVSHAVAQFELPLHAVVLLKRGSIPKTSSGKIQRHACRNGFLANTLPVISSSISTQSDRHTKIQEILIQHPNVEQVVIVNKTDDCNSLIAYIVPTQEKVPTVGDIRHFIDRRLSETETIAFVLLEALPLKPDGAIDFDALPIPQRTRSAQNYVSPRNPLEQKLANIWAEVLWIEHVSIDDNFFALGGSSLLAVTAIAKIEEELAIEFTPENLPQLSTIADLTPVVREILAKKSNLSEAIDSQFASEYRQILTYVAGWKGERVTNAIVGLNTQGSHQPMFWCLQGFRELSQLAKYLGEDQPIYGMRSGHLAMEYTPENIKALAAIYVEEILSVCSEPYILGGNCQSAWIIWEVAQQLIGKGKTITLLCLMEQFIPQTYSGKIALFFGRESKYNPYKRFVSPELGISKFYKDFSLDVFPGKHGQFFNEPNIQILTLQIAQAIAQAQINSQGDRLLPPQAYNAKLSTDSLDIAAGESSTILVRVENISTVTWKKTDVSGIRLGNHWLDGSGKVVCWCDGVANLDRELTPQAAIDLHLRVTAPNKIGSYKLELDLVEEGVTWFKDKGSKTAVVDIEVFSPQPELQKNQKIDISPEYNIESLVQQGHLCFERGDFASAIAFYQSAIKLAPQQPTRVYQNLGIALSDREDFDAAIIAYNKALELETNNAELYYLLAKAQAKQGLLSKAAINYYKAIELEPKPWFYSDLGSVLLRLNRFTEAVEIYDRAIELNDRDPVLYIKLGSAQIKADRPEIGVQSYATAIELNPDRTEVYTKRMGDELCQQGNFEAALSAYRRSLAINPRQHKVYIALGNALSRLNQTEDAIALYREAIALNPEHAALYSSLGNARRKIGDRNGAIKSYRRSLELNPRQYQTSIALGNTLCKNKNWTEATAVFERAIKLKPRHFKAYNGFANAQHKQGNLQAALAAYRRCLELNPRNFNTYVAFGNTLSQANQTEEAIEAYSKAIELSPQPPFNIYLKLGDCLTQQGYRAKAIAAYREAIGLKPNRRDLQNRLAKLVKQEASTPKIPRNLILFWDNKESIPEQIDLAIKKTIERNPDYNVIYADDNFMYEFIQSKYDREVLDLYKLNKIPASRSDLARLMLLYEYGGLYLDAAMEVQTSIDTLIDREAELVLVRRDDYFLYTQCPEKSHITNNIIGSIPRCNLIKETIVKVIDNLRYGKYNNLVWWASGPYSLNCLFEKYEQNYRVRQLYFSQLKDNFFFYRRVCNVSGSWTKQQTTSIIDKSYYFPRQETIQAYEKAIKSQPNNPYLYFSIGKIQAKNKNFSAAIASYQKAIQLDRDYIFAYLDLAKVYSEQGCFDRAIAVYREVIDMQPFLADIYEPLGDAQLKLKQVKLAISSYQLAIELSPQPPFNIYLKLADCFTQQGLVQDAIASYQAALKLKPNSEAILTRIDNLEQKLKSIASGDRVKLLKKDTFVICVLGMHRSGTSCLAGSLQAAGIPGGKVNQYATDNIRGNRENESILALNKKILADNNGAWNFPPNTLNYSLEHQQERDLLVKELSYHSVWMFKDPRTVLTLPFWQEGIAYLQPIATFRHPLKVAMSLNRRQESVPLREGLKLWIHYNSLILKAFDKSPFPLICFDLPQPEYSAQLTKVIDELNNNLDLKLAKSQVIKFYESTLIDRENTAILSPTPEDKQLLARAESIYQELREKAGLQANLQTVRSSLLVPLEESLTAYLQAIKSQPDNWQLHFMLAKMQHDEGDIKGAIASSRTALKLNPDNIDIVEQLSQLLIESERVDEAIILLEQLLDSQPENPRIYLFLGKILRQHDRTEAAIKSYQKAVELIPHDLTSQVHLGRLLLQNNQNNEAIYHYKQALQLHPQSHQIYFDLGKAHFKQKAWKLAISNYKKAIKLNDTSAAVYIHLANAYKQQGNKRQALKTYCHAIASNPNNVRGYVALGNFYRQQKKWDKAIDHYQKAIALNCQNAGVYFALGECWRQKRNWTQAIDSYQEALNLDYHKSFELYKVIGDTLTELNEINSAISAYQKAMKINPDSSEVKNSLRAVDRKLNCI